MPLRKKDKHGNPFKEGWVYDLYTHKLELIQFLDNGTRAEFVLIENNGALDKGKRLNLNLDNNYIPIGPGKLAVNNKAASIFLEREW